MKIIELDQSQPTLSELVNMARQELVILRGATGEFFALSQVDEFDTEVELLKNNPEFLAFLDQLSQEEATISLEDLKKELNLVD